MFYQKQPSPNASTNYEAINPTINSNLQHMKKTIWLLIISLAAIGVKAQQGKLSLSINMASAYSLDQKFATYRNAFGFGKGINGQITYSIGDFSISLTSQVMHQDQFDVDRFNSFEPNKTYIFDAEPEKTNASLSLQTNIYFLQTDKWKPYAGLGYGGGISVYSIVLAESEYDDLYQPSQLNSYLFGTLLAGVRYYLTPQMGLQLGVEGSLFTNALNSVNLDYQFNSLDPKSPFYIDVQGSLGVFITLP